MPTVGGMPVTATERFVTIYPELRLAVKCWGPPECPNRILAGHGWMDNAATWDLLGPKLAQAGYLLAAVDLPGHGCSDHHPSSCTYHAMDYAACFMDAADALGWSTFIVCGHSMSAGLASVLAGSYPARVTGCILVEGVGLSLRKAEDSVEHFVKGRATQSAGARGGSVYPSLEAAVDARLATVARYPGNQYLSREAARALVQRALVQAPQPHDSSEDSSPAPALAWTFRHDRRIVGPSLISPSETHARAFLQGIRCSTLLLTASNGWPWPREVADGRIEVLSSAISQARAACALKARAKALAQADAQGGLTPAAETTEEVPQFRHVHLEGGHHLHADPDTFLPVADAILAFLRDAVAHQA